MKMKTDLYELCSGFLAKIVGERSIPFAYVAAASGEDSFNPAKIVSGSRFVKQ